MAHAVRGGGSPLMFHTKENSLYASGICRLSVSFLFFVSVRFLVHDNGGRG
jgi:hypothetical protein